MDILGCTAFGQATESGDCGDILGSQVSANPPHCSDDPSTSCISDAQCNPGARCVFPDYPCAGIPGVDDDGDGRVDEPGRLDTYPIVFSVVKGEPRVTLADTRITLFSQDTWRVGSHWQLDYGLRYDVSTFRLPEGTSVPSNVPAPPRQRSLPSDPICAPLLPQDPLCVFVLAVDADRRLANPLLALIARHGRLLSRSQIRVMTLSADCRPPKTTTMGVLHFNTESALLKP